MIIAAVPAALCLVYWLVIVLYAGISADFSWIWLVFAAGLLLTRIPGLCGRILSVLMAVGIAALLLLALPVLRGMFTKPQSGLEYVIVEGAQVKGTVPSRSLRLRLEQAWSYAQGNPDTVFILSGGQGSGENISEAVCMQTWLLEKGLEQERMLVEDQSISTEENLLFSDRLAGCADRSVGLISNDFHIYRSLHLARLIGYRDVHGIPAKSDPVLQVHFVVREVFALVYGMVKSI